VTGSLDKDNTHLQDAFMTEQQIGCFQITVNDPVVMKVCNTTQ